METTPKYKIERATCCEVFKTLAPTFSWSKTDTGEILMPYVTVNGIHWRVNNCPSCGAYVRDIVLTEKEFKELTQ
jgi:hypothetical protein